MNGVTVARVGIVVRPRLTPRAIPGHVRRWQSTSSSHSDQQPNEPTFLDRIRGWTSLRGQVVQERVGGFVSSANSNFAHWGALLNRMSGYEEIHALKQTVVENEVRITQARQAARDTKAAFDKAASARVASQREVNDLLQRKASWTESDVSRFTALVRADHVLEQEETRAKEAVEKAEDDVERALSALTGSILARYHEEQVWSDKIRRLSTYGQLGAMGLNVVVFIVAIVLVEPWKRKRLGETFERRVEELERDHTALVEQSIAAVRKKLDSQGKILEALAGNGEAAAQAPTLVGDGDNSAIVLANAEQRKRLETAAYSALGGAIGAGIVSVIIHLLTQ